jgi:hypothetical protein
MPISISFGNMIGCILPLGYEGSRIVDPSIVPGRGRRKFDAVMRFFPVFAGLLLAGCSLGADPGPLAQLDAVSVPDMAALAGKIQDTFRTVRLTGYPRVSPVRKAPVSAFGDWIVCLKSDAESDPRVYALIIQNNEIVDYRLALIIDGCANVRFEALPGLPPTPPPTKSPPKPKK